MAGWAVAIATPGQETKALANVARLSFEFFCPKIRVKKFGWRGRRFVRDEWLFNRYFFVAAKDRWVELEATIGVSGVIRFGEIVATLPDGIVSSVRERCDQDGFYIPVERGRFKRGQRVRIGDGPYIDRIGIYQNMKSGDRADALVQFAGAWVRASVGERELAAA